MDRSLAACTSPDCKVVRIAGRFDRKRASSLLFRRLALFAGSGNLDAIQAGIDDERGLILAHQLWQRGGREAVDPMELG